MDRLPIQVLKALAIYMIVGVAKTLFEPDNCFVGSVVLWTYSLYLAKATNVSKKFRVPFKLIWIGFAIVGIVYEVFEAITQEYGSDSDDTRLYIAAAYAAISYVIAQGFEKAEASRYGIARHLSVNRDSSLKMILTLLACGIGMLMKEIGLKIVVNCATNIIGPASFPICMLVIWMYNVYNSIIQILHRRMSRRFAKWRQLLLKTYRYTMLIIAIYHTIIEIGVIWDLVEDGLIWIPVEYPERDIEVEVDGFRFLIAVMFAVLSHLIGAIWTR